MIGKNTIRKNGFTNFKRLETEKTLTEYVANKKGIFLIFRDWTAGFYYIENGDHIVVEV